MIIGKPIIAAFWLHAVMYFTGWWLSPTRLKNMTASVGMMTFPIYGKIKAMFQTTDQIHVLNIRFTPFYPSRQIAISHPPKIRLKRSPAWPESRPSAIHLGQS